MNELIEDELGRLLYKLERLSAQRPSLRDPDYIEKNREIDRKILEAFQND